MDNADVVVTMGLRTPFSPFGGPMRDIPSLDLGAIVIKELLERTKVEGKDINETGMEEMEKLWEESKAVLQ